MQRRGKSFASSRPARCIGGVLPSTARPPLAQLQDAPVQFQTAPVQCCPGMSSAIQYCPDQGGLCCNPSPICQQGQGTHLHQQPSNGARSTAAGRSSWPTTTRWSRQQMQPSSQQRPPLQSSSSRNLSPEQQPTHRGGLSIPTGTAASAVWGQWRIQMAVWWQCARVTGNLDAMQMPSTTSSPATARPTTSALRPRPPWRKVLPNERMRKDKSERVLWKVSDIQVAVPSSIPNFLLFSLESFSGPFVHFYFRTITQSFFSYSYCSYLTTTKSSSCVGCN